MGKASLPRYDAAYLNNRPPRYPSKAVELNESGKVTLDVYVDADGRAKEVSVKRSSGFERLDSAAKDAVRFWRFEPARVGNQAVGANVLITIPFN